MTIEQADRIIEDAELDMFALPPLEAYQPLPEPRSVRREADKLSDAIDAELRSLERMIYAAAFVGGFFVYCLFAF